MTENAGDIEALVRRVDYDRYLASVFAKPDVRPAIHALLAFNYEIARVREVVSESMLGEIRLQWWREALDGISAGTPRKHDVVEALAQAIEAHDLPLKPFYDMIDGRTLDLYDEGPKDMKSLMSYAQSTGGLLQRQWLHILGYGDDRELMTRAGAAGTAFALTGLLRAVQFHAAAGRNMLPADALKEAGISAESIYRGDFLEEHHTLFNRIHDAAQNEVARASGPVPKDAVSAFLPAVLAKDYLKRLKANNYQPERQTAGLLTRQFKLLVAWMKRII